MKGDNIMDFIGGMILGGVITFFAMAIFSAVRNCDENE